MPAARLLAGLLLLLAAACGSGSAPGEDEARARHRQQQAHYEDMFRRFELQGEAALYPDLEGRCDAPPAAGRPWLCIRLLGPRRLAKGSGLRFRVEWRGLPAEAGLAVSLERAAPAGERWRYQGPIGPLGPATLPVPGDGRRYFAWDGRRVQCPASDTGAPVCGDVEIGAYRLIATVVDRAGHPTVSGMIPPPPVTLLAWTRSGAFSIAGLFDMRTLLNAEGGATLVRAYVDRRLGVAAGTEARLVDGPLPAVPTLGGYCTVAALRPPLRGPLRMCIDRRFVTATGVTAKPDDLALSGEISRSFDPPPQ